MLSASYIKSSAISEFFFENVLKVPEIYPDTLVMKCNYRFAIRENLQFGGAKITAI